MIYAWEKEQAALLGITPKSYHERQAELRRTQKPIGECSNEWCCLPIYREDNRNICKACGQPVRVYLERPF